jgi:hypothetical protein
MPAVMLISECYFGVVVLRLGILLAGGDKPHD